MPRYSPTKTCRISCRNTRYESRPPALFGFRQVQRCPAALGDDCNQEDDKAEKLGNDEPAVALGFDNLPQIERAGQHHHAMIEMPMNTRSLWFARRHEDREQRVFVVGRIACQHNAVNRQRGQRQEEKQPKLKSMMPTPGAKGMTANRSAS